MSPRRAKGKAPAKRCGVRVRATTMHIIHVHGVFRCVARRSPVL